MLEPMRQVGGDELVRSLLRTFVDHVPERLQNIREAVEGLDPEVLGRAAHSLRSAAATIGAMDLSKLAGELEGLADAGELEAFLERTPLLERRVEELAASLSGELES